MAIQASDIQRRLSGGAGNTDPAASLGGVISSTAITSASIHNLFDLVVGAESTTGDTEYRCFYLRNGHATLTWYDAKVWIETNTPAAGSAVEIGLGTAAVNGTEQTVANESTAPSGVSFSTAAGSANALTIGDIPAGQHKAVWVKRTISAGASAYDTDSVVLGYTGDTAA